MPKRFDFADRLYVLFAVILGAIVIFLGFRAVEIWHSIGGDYPREVNVEATASAFVVPDVAEVTLGLNVTAPTAEEAVKQNTETMDKVQKALEDLGIAQADIKTSNYSLYENYVWNGETSKPEGYRLDHSVQVKIRDFDQIGDVIGRSTDAGANVVNNVNFIIDDLESAKSLARDEAIMKAKQKAQDISKQSGLHLGKILTYYEYSNDNYPSPISYGKGGGDVMMSEAAALPNIQPGQQEVSLTVSLTYRVK